MGEELPDAVVGARDRDGLMAAVSAEGWPLDLADAELDDGGWENIALVSRDWIVRFPRDATLPLKHELEMLERLRDRLPVAIPRVLCVGRRVRMMAYRKLTGFAFDERAYSAADPARRDRVARSLAGFLAAVHAVQPGTTTPVVRPADMHRRVVESLDRIPRQRRDEIAELADQFAEVWVVPGIVPGPQVLLHNDFHPMNMVFDGPVGELTGVWDFSCVSIGVPTFDLRYFDRGTPDLMARLADQYTARTGRPVDVAAAALARRIEDVEDTVTTGRMELLERL
jgi:aminoglycoside phosphotransferase (APT) family kinase protein